MVRALKLSGVVCGMLAVTTAASAGPIEWGYTAHVQTETGIGVLNMGTYRLGYDPSGRGTVEPVYGDYTITAPLAGTTRSGTYRDAVHGQFNDTIELASVGYGYSVNPAAVVPPSDPTFLLTFTLTDLASGESGMIRLTGRAGASTTDMYPTPVLFWAGLTPHEAELRLGKNLYHITAVDGLPEEMGEPANVGLRITATSSTPEPASLALAGFGLASAAGLRLRRRFAAR
jgi:hypothetical protein